MNKKEFDSIVADNAKWAILLAQCSDCKCFTNAEYCGRVVHCFDCRNVKGWRWRVFCRSILMLRWKIEHFLFTGYSGRKVLCVNPTGGYFIAKTKNSVSRYYASSSQPKNNWPFAIWRRNFRRIVETRLIRWE